MNKNSLSEKNSFLHTTLASLENFLEDFVCSQKGPASIKALRKTARASEYVVCNEALLFRDGIPMEDYIGLTAYDIGNITSRKPSVTENAVNMDNKILNKALLYTEYKQAILTNDGCINVEAVSKKPVYSKNNQIIGLLAYARDITNYIEPMHLFKLYRQYHKTQKAINCLIQHMGLSKCFYNLPTQRELEVLLNMKQSTAAKDIARVLRLSPKTVYQNKTRLCDRLKNITLAEVIMKLRTHHEIKEGVIG